MKKKEFYAFTGPSIFMIISLMVIPLALCVVFSLQRLSLGTPARFIGFTNYARILAGDRFWNAMGNTILYIGISVPVQIVLGFVIALSLDRVERLRGLFIGSSLLPHILTPAVGALVISWLFRDYWGFYDYLLGLLGVKVQWHANPWGTRLLIMVYMRSGRTPPSSS